MLKERQRLRENLLFQAPGRQHGTQSSCPLVLGTEKRKHGKITSGIDEELSKAETGARAYSGGRASCFSQMVTEGLSESKWSRDKPDGELHPEEGHPGRGAASVVTGMCWTQWVLARWSGSRARWPGRDHCRLLRTAGSTSGIVLI